MSEQATSPLSEGHVIDRRYIVHRLLGNGGMGAVYEAEHKLTGRRVAVKVLLGAMREHHVHLGRFANEGKHGTRVVHKNVAAVLDMGVDRDTGDLYLVQELLRGRDLRALLDERRVLSPREAIEILSPLLAALEFAHARGVVHRDVKPDNIVMATQDDGTVCPKLIDFGIAAAIFADATTPRMTTTGAILGTPAYMSPEQARGQRATPQADVWAAGVVLYEMLSGTVPYDDESAAVVFARLLTQTPTRLGTRVRGISPELEAIVHRALEPDCAQRFQSAKDLRLALEALPIEALSLEHRRSGSEAITLDIPRDSSASTLSPASVRRATVSKPRGATIGVAIALCASVLVMGGLSAPRTTSAANPTTHPTSAPPALVSTPKKPEGLSPVAVGASVRGESSSSNRIGPIARPVAAPLEATTRPARTATTTRVRPVRAALAPIDTYPGALR